MDNKPLISLFLLSTAILASPHYANATSIVVLDPISVTDEVRPAGAGHHLLGFDSYLPGLRLRESYGMVSAGSIPERTVNRKCCPSRAEMLGRPRNKHCSFRRARGGAGGGFRGGTEGLLGGVGGDSHGGFSLAGSHPGGGNGSSFGGGGSGGVLGSVKHPIDHVPVPAPVAGGGIVGLILSCGVLFFLARRRKGAIYDTQANKRW